MGSLAEPEPIFTPKLPPLLTIMSPKESPEDLSGTTPPLYTSASIPFQWEEEPGKPRPCTALIATVSDHPNTEGPKSLELPPRLQLTESKMTKLPSPTTVLDVPYMGFLPKFQEASSFLYKRPGHHRKGSSVSNYSVGSPERGQLGDMVLVSRRGVMRKEIRGGGLLGSFGRRRSGKEELVGGKGRMVRPSSMESVEGFGGGDIEGGDIEGGGRSSRWEGMPKIRRIGSFSGLSEAARSKYFWATVYEGFKQALPWKSNK